ncbi:MAG TPA: hypothetical protein VJN64_06855 [Terriglobales bacterium]|nr:hypothetical protein [Terriglobales bacterium]
MNRIRDTESAIYAEGARAAPSGTVENSPASPEVSNRELTRW